MICVRKKWEKIKINKIKIKRIEMMIFIIFNDLLSELHSPKLVSIINLP
jgi:hypothetical protein